MDRTNYILLHRKSLDSQVFASAELWRLWSWVLMRAVWKKQSFTMETGRGFTTVNVEPGQFVFGRHTAARELKCPPSTVARRMKKLEQLGNISIQASSHYSIVTVCNWSSYQHTEQDIEQATEPATAQQRTSNEPASSTYKQGNKVNKVNKKTAAAVPPVFVCTLEVIETEIGLPQHLKTKRLRAALQRWLSWKQTSPDPYRSINGPGDLLKRISKHTEAQVCEGLSLAFEAIDSGKNWSTFYPTKTDHGRPEPLPGGVPKDAKLQRELGFTSKIKELRRLVQTATTDDQRNARQRQLDAVFQARENAIAEGVTA